MFVLSPVARLMVGEGGRIEDLADIANRAATVPNLELLQDIDAELFADSVIVLATFTAVSVALTTALPPLSDLLFRAVVIPVGAYTVWCAVRNALVSRAVRVQNERVDTDRKLPSILVPNVLEALAVVTLAVASVAAN
jgi:hypothetical protein